MNTNLPTALPTASWSRRKDISIAVLIFFVALFTFVFYKIDVQNPNTATRLVLCLAILEDQTLAIDKYAYLTCDKSFADGHFYCDKAPGSSFLILPVVAVIHYTFRLFGITDYTTPQDDVPGSYRYYLLMELGSSLPVSAICAFAVAFLYLLGRFLGATPGVSFLTALLFGFGTPYWAWATVLFGHSLAAAFLLFATGWGVWLIISGSVSCPACGTLANTNAPQAGRLTWFAWIGIGFILAYAVWIEYPAAVPACLIGVLFLGMKISRKERMTKIVQTAGWLFLGTIPVALAFFAYNTACFGGLLTLGYTYEHGDFPEMAKGFFGIQHPDPAVLWKTLFTMRYGIFWYSPFLLFSPFLAMVNIRQNRNRSLNILAIVVPVFFFLLNASYAYWMETYLPCRHATLCFPFAVIPFLSLGLLKQSVFRNTIYLFCYATLLLRGISFFVPQSKEFYLENLPSIEVIRFPLRTTQYNLFSYVNLPGFVANIAIILVWGQFAIIIWYVLQCHNSEPRTSVNDQHQSRVLP